MFALMYVFVPNMCSVQKRPKGDTVGLEQQNTVSSHLVAGN